MREKDYSGDAERNRRVKGYTTKEFRDMYEKLRKDADLMADVLVKAKSNEARRSIKSLERALRYEARMYAELAKIKLFEIEDENDGRRI